MMTELFFIPNGLPVDIYKHINDFLFGYDRDVHTPRHMAKTNNLQGVKWIVQHKKWTRNDKNNALRCAAAYGHVEMVQCLVSQGADVISLDNYALRCAAENGHLKVVQYLVSQGADVPSHHNYAVQRAVYNGHLEVVQYLVSQGADVSADNNWAVKWAVKCKNRKMVQYLVSQGVSLLN
jgi:ankyrin repeat protein